MFVDSEGAEDAQIASAHRQAHITAGVEGNPHKLLQFLRWQTLRVEGPLREIAQNEQVGPIPLATAWAAEGLQLLLGICADGQQVANADPTALTADLKAARQALIDAVSNVDILLKLVSEVEKRFS